MNPVLAVAVVAIATAVIVVILVLTARGRGKGPAGPRPRVTGRSNVKGSAGAPAGGRKWPCPLCGELLGPGERIRSVIRLSPRHGRIMEISGCPKCLPPSSRPRRCPVCKAQVGPDEVLTAQVFDRSRQSAKPHVHVLGCGKCMG
jgi:hypothetical protein